MPIPLYIVDAFASQPFKGNPAAVCLLEGAMPADWMQSVAMEMNLSETAFVFPNEDGFNLRWFTPKVEVDLCGHATLATAHVLWRHAGYPSGPLRFSTRSGLLSATIEEDLISLDFPSKLAIEAPPPPCLLESLGATASFIGLNGMDYLVEVKSPAIVRQLRPDFVQLSAIPVRGVIVTARSDQPEYDFISRFFAPATGVNEDPVTGSAHCALGPYWSNIFQRDDLVGYQASERGGIVRIRMEGDRTHLVGQAVTVMEGQLV